MKSCGQKDESEFDEYLKTLKANEFNNNIFFSHKNKIKNQHEFITFFKSIEKNMYTNINDAVEYLVLSDAFDTFEKWCLNIVDDLISYSSLLKKGYINKLSKLTIYMILLYSTKACLNKILESPEFIDYDELCQIAININYFDVIDDIFDKIKVTSDQYNIIIKKADSPYIESLLIKCLMVGLFPEEETVYELLERGVKVSNEILALYKINNENNIRYIIAKIKGKHFDFKKERLKRFKFNDNEKENIKTAIFQNSHQYTDKNLDALSKMFDLKYDERCFKLFCENSLDHNGFNYLINCGIKPDYESICIIVNKLHSASQIKKFFLKN
jgi:hypothetical protein